METKEHPKESGHWYSKDGTPVYTVKGKTGERPTTLRDARKEGYVPSVTSIISLAARPGLQNWMNDQLILACLTMPRIDGEAEVEYVARIKKDSKEQAAKAAERGTLIHAWVQDGFEGGEPNPFYFSAQKTLAFEQVYADWKCEESFAFDGYGGKIDLHSWDYLIDIKTTDKDLETVKTWDEHSMQLAAYDWGLSQGLLKRKCGILYINVNTAESKLIWISGDDIEKGLKCFKALLDFYYAKTGL